MSINLSEMITLICNNDPIKVYMDLIENDEEFKGFIEKNKNRSTSEMIEKYNLNDVLLGEK